jgi:hypothetical protein
VKLVFWDGTGVVLISKRPEDGEFRMQRDDQGESSATIKVRMSRVP